MEEREARSQWTSTLKTYASPVIGSMSVGSIGLDEVLRILRPIWKEKPETASRLRGRIEAVLDYAGVHGWRKGDNPARWTGYLDQMLPAKAKVRAVVHHAAVAWADMPGVWAKLGRGWQHKRAMPALPGADCGPVWRGAWREVERD